MNGTEIYFDIDVAQLKPVNGRLVEQPTLIALHGGLGLDHGYLKPGLTPLRDSAQAFDRSEYYVRITDHLVARPTHRRTKMIVRVARHNFGYFRQADDVAEKRRTMRVYGLKMPTRV
ncbi:hypothetical protein AB7813_05515 [Tardiphaga sp. 20_F10_N6_6]|uniref:hypothetical protein n=1 Tax=Tardiphaga sp. 20_F10_N6_6 TaxID=3240788 RepID=UPI003F8ACDDF